MCLEHFQHRLGNGRGGARGVKKAVHYANLSTSALSGEIGLVSGWGQVDSKEVVHTLTEESKFSSSSHCTGRWVGSGEARGANVRNHCRVNQP